MGVGGGGGVPSWSGGMVELLTRLFQPTDAAVCRRRRRCKRHRRDGGGRTHGPWGQRGEGGQREDERRAREKEERMKMKVHVPLAPRQKKLSGKCKRLMTCAVRHYCNHGWQSL